jgi:hypothetical protein
MTSRKTTIQRLENIEALPYLPRSRGPRRDIYKTPGQDMKKKKFQEGKQFEERENSSIPGGIYYSLPWGIISYCSTRG